MSHSDFATRIAHASQVPDREPVDRIRVPAGTGLLEIVYATAVGHAASAVARHENGAPDLSRDFVAVHVMAVGKHSATEIEYAITMALSARAWIIVIDDGSDPAVDNVLSAHGAR